MLFRPAVHTDPNPTDSSLQQESFNKYLWNWAEYSTLHFKQLYLNHEMNQTAHGGSALKFIIIAKVYTNNSWLLWPFTQKLTHLPLQNPVRWLRGHYRLTLMKKKLSLRKVKMAAHLSHPNVNGLAGTATHACWAPKPPCLCLCNSIHQKHTYMKCF